MTPAKRRPATPVSPGSTRMAPDVPRVANRAPASPAETNDDTQLLGPEGEPIAEAATRDAGDNSAPPPDGPTDPEARATQLRRRPGGLYPLPVWPD